MLAARDGRLLLAAQSLDALAIGVAGVALPWLVLNGGGSHVTAVETAPLSFARAIANRSTSWCPR